MLPLAKMNYDISHPYEVNLTDEISRVPGDDTTISIVDPMIFIERTADEHYRINTSFTLEVEIIDFDQESVLLYFSDFLGMLGIVT
jgi:hypothetical protein